MEYARHKLGTKVCNRLQDGAGAGFVLVASPRLVQPKRLSLSGNFVSTGPFVEQGAVWAAAGHDRFVVHNGVVRQGEAGERPQTHHRAGPSKKSKGLQFGADPEGVWRRVMGIEPTEQSLSTRPIGFEDRDQHQHSETRHQILNLF